MSSGTEQIKGWSRLRPYQQESARLLRNGDRQGLWMATGTGKTAVLLAALGLSGFPFPALFITKAIGRHVFPRDASWVLGDDLAPAVLWSGQTRGSGVHYTRGRRTYTSLSLALSENLGVATNYDLLSLRAPELLQVPWRALIVDEAHEIRGGHRPVKKRDGTLHRQRYHYVKQLASLVRMREGVVWTATATPVVDRRRDLFAQLDIACPGVFGSAWSFLHRYCDSHRNEWGGLDTRGVSHTDELYSLIRDHFVMVKRDDIADQLPLLQRDLCMVSPDLGSSGSWHRMGGGVESAIERAAELKESFVLDYAADYLAGGLKIVAVTTRRRLAHKLSLALTSKEFAKRLPRQARDELDVQCITGEIDARTRVGTIERFNARSRGPAALVATIDSIQASVDLQQTDGVLVAALPYVPGVMMQLEGRFSRLGGRPTTIHYLIAEHTIDEVIKETLLAKVDDIERLHAGTQGPAGLSAALSGQINEEEIVGALREFLDGLDHSEGVAV